MGEITETVWVVVAVIVVFCALVITMLVIKSNNAQPSLVVTGVVKDAATGQPIANAKVSDDGYGSKPYRSTITDSSGKYRYVTWPQEHNILAQAQGYKTQLQILATSLLHTEEGKVLDFALVPE